MMPTTMPVRIRAVLIGLMLAFGLSACGINNVPTLQEQAKSAWSEVQNQYQRRADLIPNLVETVKGYAQQEREVLTQVTEARAKATQIKVDASTVTDPEKFQQFQEAQNQLSGALGRLLVTVERYPDLKSNAELPGPAIAARGHREPHRRGAARLHRDGAGLQHRDPHHSGPLDRRHPLSGRQADGDVRGHRRAPTGRRT